MFYFCNNLNNSIILNHSKQTETMRLYEMNSHELEIVDCEDLPDYQVRIKYIINGTKKQILLKIDMPWSLFLQTFWNWIRMTGLIRTGSNF